MLESGQYVFTAQSVQPTGGRTVNLSSTTYTIAVKDQRVKADLPYFGRAYASHYTSEGGIKFEGESTDIVLKENEKKNLILLSFNVTDSGKKYELNMSFTPSFYGTVTIISRDRQSISYHGYVEEMSDDYKF
jgi:hypothetical protein